MYYLFNFMVVHNMSIVSPKPRTTQQSLECIDIEKNLQINSTILLNVGGTKTLESALNKITDLI